MNELMDKLVKMAGKIDRNKYLKGIKDSLMTLLPLIIIGSFASLFSTLFKSEWASGMGLFVVFGGTGYTLSLILAVLVFSKRKDYREVAKMCLIPGIFGINEPVTYGMPIVLNPILGIPFIIAPCVCALLGYLFTSIGFAPCATVELPAGLPVFVNAIVGYPGSVTALLAVAVCFVVAFLIYAPFVIAANRIKQEGAENE